LREPNLAYAVMAMSIISAGRIASMDTAQAERAEGVIAESHFVRFNGGRA
jgi:hypothetical protein